MAAAFRVLKARAARRRAAASLAKAGLPDNLGEETENADGAVSGIVPNLNVQKDKGTHNPGASSTAQQPKKKRPVEPEYVLPYQEPIFKAYTHASAQWLVAFIIISNFVVTITEKEIDPYPPELQFHRERWEVLDRMFTVIFLVELIINQYGKFFFFFWYDWWNVFDFAIVLVSVLDMFSLLDGPFSMLKMLRSFRVFRLFKRIQSLNKIVTSLFRAIPGVFNAFLIMLIVMCIYAILAVESFRDFGVHGEYFTEQTLMDANGMTYVEIHNASSITMREMRMNQEYYGTFFRSLFTLFQVLTGESWAEAIARPLIFGLEAGAFGPAIFFTSFILVMQIVLVNVVVAVLLDKFVDDDSAPAAAPAKPDESADKLAALSEDVNTIKEQLGELTELKAKMDSLIDVISQTYKLNA